MPALSLASQSGVRGFLTGSDIRALMKLFSAINAVQYKSATPYAVGPDGRLRIGGNIDGVMISYETPSRKPGDASLMEPCQPCGHLSKDDRDMFVKFLAAVEAIGTAGDPGYVLNGNGSLSVEFGYGKLQLQFQCGTGGKPM